MSRTVAQFFEVSRFLFLEVVGLPAPISSELMYEV
jgi:hypothetical protein